MAPERTVIRWVGPGPDPTVRRALRARGVAIARDRRGGATAVVVASGTLPATIAAEGTPWIWFGPRGRDGAKMRAAVLAGAYDAVDDAAGADAVAARICERLTEIAHTCPTTPKPDEMVAESPAARRLLDELYRAARTDMPVLLTGETGTGKELAARLVHAWSPRKDRRFVPINCAAVPNELLESELFGYARGAFSGAVRPYDGQLVAAEGGTVFLDEVDDTPLPFQIKLLRVLEDRVVSRLGENVWRTVNFRLVAATNRELYDLIARGLFGQDLYERLAILSIRLPPLRDRREDIPALVRHMMARFRAESPSGEDRPIVHAVTPEAEDALARYAWPGNIRELRNVIFSALVRKHAGHELLPSDLPRRVLTGAAELRDTGALTDPAAIENRIAAGTFNLASAIERIEKAALVAALARTGGNAAAAARLLGHVGRGTARDPGATLRAMMKRLGVKSVA